MNKLLSLRIDSEHGPHIAFVVPGDVHAVDVESPDDEDDFAWRQTQFLRLSGWVSLESRLSVSLCKMDVFDLSDSQLRLAVLARYSPIYRDDGLRVFCLEMAPATCSFVCRRLKCLR